MVYHRHSEVESWLLKPAAAADGQTSLFCSCSSVWSQRVQSGPREDEATRSSKLLINGVAGLMTGSLKVRVNKYIVHDSSYTVGSFFSFSAKNLRFCQSLVVFARTVAEVVAITFAAIVLSFIGRQYQLLSN